MVYSKPPALTRRVINPLVSRLHPRGVETLTVVGRRTGRPRRVPVLPVQVGSQRYEAYRKQAGRTVDRLFRSMPEPASHPVFALDADGGPST